MLVKTLVLYYLKMKEHCTVFETYGQWKMNNNNNNEVKIKDKQQYDYVKGYVMNYITELLNKMTIVKKKELREIYNDLDNVGYCTSDRKYNFLIKFLEVDYKHKGTHIEKYVYDMKRYKEEMNRGGTLEKWLVS